MRSIDFGATPVVLSLSFSLLALAAGCSRPAAPQVQTATHVRVVRVQGGALPRSNPNSELWDLAPEYTGNLAPQNIAPPTLTTPSVARVKVRALHDGDWVAFRLEWEDRTKDELSGPALFSDAVAVQFPRDRSAAPPSPMMGHPTGPVRILYWKAAWQVADMLQALHPNRAVSPYPFEATTGDARAALEGQYAPARYVRNPNLVRPGNGPVFVGEAEGFGSLSPGQGEGDGRGVHQNNSWLTVLAIRIGAAATSPIAVGQTTNVAFAVWEGHAQNTGSRKMRSENWVRMTIEGG